MTFEKQQDRNIKLVVEYDGTNYCGWQVQNNGLAIAHVLENALERITGDVIKTFASGRTDAGVHAFGQTVNFHTSSSIPAERFAQALNSVLPEDIVVRASSEVQNEWNARFDAVGKHYRYIITPRKCALLAGRALRVRYSLDVKRMNEVASLFVGEHDFSAFMAAGSSVKTTVRTIYNVNVCTQKIWGNDCIVFDVVGSGFLYNMVRIMVGTLIDVSRGHIDEKNILTAFETGEREALGFTAGPEGLYLVEVFYDTCKSISEKNAENNRNREN